MTVPVITFLSGKGNTGRTSLAHHVAWMLAGLEHQILAADLDPQAGLTTAFLQDEQLEGLWDRNDGRSTVFQCLAPLAGMGDINPPRLREVSPHLFLLPGDLALAGFEGTLSEEWPNCLGGDPRRAFRVETAFWQALQMGAAECGAEFILVDVGPGLGAINRAALIASDFVVMPLETNLFSRRDLRSLGPALRAWRREWDERRRHWAGRELDLPSGSMKPVGYILKRYAGSAIQPGLEYVRWSKEMPFEYDVHVLGRTGGHVKLAAEDDPNCIAFISHYWGLAHLGREARKPVFALTSADGAIGSLAVLRGQAYRDFSALSREIIARTSPDEESAEKTSPKGAAAG